MVAIKEDSSDNGSNNHKPSLTNLQAAVQKRRAPRMAVSDEKSLSMNALPDWAKPHWKSHFVPSLLDILADEENPWEIDRKQDNSFLQILQDIVDALYARANCTVEKNGKIFRMVWPLKSCSLCCPILTVLYLFLVKASYS
jgi:hypothetical protein